MKYIFVVLLAFLSLPAVAGESHESKAVNFMEKACIEPVLNNKDPAALAEQNNFKEAKIDSQLKIAWQERTFFAPGFGDDVVLATFGKEKDCLVAISDVNFDKFWSIIDQSYPAGGAFKKVKEEKRGGQPTLRAYLANVKGPIGLIVVGWDGYAPGADVHMIVSRKRLQKN